VGVNLVEVKKPHKCRAKSVIRVRKEELERWV